MARRFTDTEKWKKPFIRGLQGAYKLLWLYICDDCYHAGIWQVDIDVAKIRIGEDINTKEALTAFGDKVVSFDGGTKWFIPSFIEFQYPSGLNPSNNAHSGVIRVLDKYKLLKNKPHISPLQESKDKDMDKDKDMVMDMDKEEGLNISFEDFWNLYDKKVGDRQKLIKKWGNLKDEERELAVKHISKYKIAQPDKKFRKDPQTYLNNKSWNDEIIFSSGIAKQQQSGTVDLTKEFNYENLQ